MLRIKEIAKQKGYTMQQLADKIGIVRDTLTRQAGGNPTIATLQKIADALGVGITELFDTTVGEKPEKVLRCPNCGEEIHISLSGKN